MLYHDDWVEFDNTGLKGVAEAWAKNNLEPNKLHKRIERFSVEEYKSHLKKFNRVVIAIGFQRRELQLNAECTLKGYEITTGIIGPGLFGTGMAFP